MRTDRTVLPDAMRCGFLTQKNPIDLSLWDSFEYRRFVVGELSGAVVEPKCCPSSRPVLYKQYNTPKTFKSKYTS